MLLLLISSLERGCCLVLLGRALKAQWSHTVLVIHALLLLAVKGFEYVSTAGQFVIILLLFDGHLLRINNDKFVVLKFKAYMVAS